MTKKKIILKWEKDLLRINFNNYSKEYLSDYDEGYRIGIREITKLY